MTFSIKKKATKLVFVGLWHLAMNFKCKKNDFFAFFLKSGKLQNTQVMFEY